ncbi:MAG: nitroreductase family protein [Planctomycetota bacterium]
MSNSHSITDIIRERRTEKVLVDVDAPFAINLADAATHQATVVNAVETAGMAPFHFDRGVDSIAEPWRAYTLTHDAARRLAIHLRDRMTVRSKEPNLLAGCGALVLVTWLPEALDSSYADSASPAGNREKLRARDEEHLAATGAMVQNLLLLLTAAGMGTYWSSGGKLGSPEVFDLLGISPDERLIAAVFIEFPDMAGQPATRKTGSQKDKRSGRWFHKVDLAEATDSAEQR